MEAFDRAKRYERQRRFAMGVLLGLQPGDLHAFVEGDEQEKEIGR